MRPSIIKCLVFFALVASVGLYSCKKEKASSDKHITSFSFTTGDNNNLNRDAVGLIGNDTIRVNVPEGTNITALKPSILFKGKSIAPGAEAIQNYAGHVRYTVTAFDGSSKVYVVIVQIFSADKNIISFTFKATDNAGVIAQDIEGSIENDTIKIVLPPATPLTSLVPAIIFSGATISPASHSPANFTNPVEYKVTATDGSAKKYTVICMINVALYFGDSDGNFYALNAATGDEAWRRKLGQVVYSATVDKGIVYVVSNEGYLYALDAKTGADRWKYPLSADDYSVPTVQDGIVYILAGGYLHKIDALSGNLVTSMNVHGYKPTVVNKTVYLPRAIYGGMVALDATNLNELWGYGGNSIFGSNPAIANGVLYVGYEFIALAALDATTGALKWRVSSTTANGAGGGNPTYCNGVVYMVSYDDELQAFNADNGTRKWRATLGIGELSSPVAYNDMVYISTPGVIYAINGSTGTVKWSLEAYLADESFGGCTYANGIVYAGNKNKYVYALNAGSGSVRWKHKADGAVTSNICVVDASGTVFHPGESGDQN